FEGCSMVPSIYPLETLHNSLSLKQVDEFLNKVCESRRETLTKTLKTLRAVFDSQIQPSTEPESQETARTSLASPLP
ncbi:inositol hexakisphosphate and diphosphoinositol-pentakisphosphate kinase 1 isoform X1, partial [Tachysurus ichikawai]